MQCLIAKLVEVGSQIVVSCIAAFRDTSDKVHALSASQKECLEWREKYCAAEFRNQAQGKKLATAYAAIAVFVVTVILCMIFPQMRLLIGLVGLGVVFGSQLLPMTSNLEQYVSQGLRLSTRLWQSASRQIRPVLGHLAQFVERIRRRVRDLKWKSVPVSRSFNTTP
jgi:hypothetical protein